MVSGLELTGNCDQVVWGEGDGWRVHEHRRKDSSR